MILNRIKPDMSCFKFLEEKGYKCIQKNKGMYLYESFKMDILINIEADRYSYIVYANILPKNFKPTKNNSFFLSHKALEYYLRSIGKRDAQVVFQCKEEKEINQSLLRLSEYFVTYLGEFIYGNIDLFQFAKDEYFNEVKIAVLNKNITRKN